MFNLGNKIILKIKAKQYNFSKYSLASKYYQGQMGWIKFDY